MARTRQSDGEVLERGATGPPRAPGKKKPRGKAFEKGNNLNSLRIEHAAGPGVPKKRYDARHFLRRALESDPADLPPVTFCAADLIGRKIASTLTGTHYPGIKQQPELGGKDLVGSTKVAYETAYGSLVVQETADHLAGQAARNHVDNLLAQADELRRRAREAKG